MRKKFLIIILCFLLMTSFVYGEIFYFSTKSGLGSLMIGVEVFDEKTKSSIKPLSYIYEWTLPDVSLEPQKTNVNLFLAPFPGKENFFFLDLKIIKPFTMETYSVKNQKIFLSRPKAKIVRKDKEGNLLPLLGKIKPTDSLTVLTKGFASKNLTYTWEFNGVFVSNEKEIFVKDLREKNGIIKVRVFGTDLREKVEDRQIIQIE